MKAFRWWGQALVRWRWSVLAVALAVVAVGATWGAGVFGVLTGGGFIDPSSESAKATERITQELGRQDADLLVLWSSEATTADQPAFRDPVTAKLTELRADPAVASVVSWYDTQAPSLLSEDRTATYAALQLTAEGDDAKMAAYEELLPELEIPGLRTQTGGLLPLLVETNDQTTKDLTRAEIFSLPVLLVLLVLIFGGLVAAAMPLLIGGLAILGGFIVVRLLTTVTDVSVFAINVITLLGLGMAIDYSLFVVSRFREEMAAGRAVPQAIGRTIATAGRTVLVSGLTIIVALASLLIFPLPFLKSIAMGGMSAVLVAMLGALTVLPALLAVLGKRIDALRIPLPWRRAGDAKTDREGGWARIARSVMRRPGLYVVGVLALLMLLAAPFLQIRFGGFDERVLPEGTQSRVTAERIADEFPGGTGAPIQVLVSGAPAETATAFAGTIAGLPEVTGATVTANRGGSSLISVTYEGEASAAPARDVVREIRDLTPPADAEVLVTGRPADDADLLTAVAAKLPWMAVIMASATLLLLFLAFGSVLLPVKAVLTNIVSITASFGVVVWAFQEGHLAGLLNFTPTGFIEPSNPILMLAVLFGLATDYEVFLLSRVREEWDRTGDNTASVAAGLQRTGGIITAAALLLIVVVAGFAAGGVAIMKLIGVGMIVAIAIDATLVRALLVPATMRLLGNWNWWAPGPLAAVYRRFGISEADPVEPASAADGAAEPVPATGRAS